MAIKSILMMNIRDTTSALLLLSLINIHLFVQITLIMTGLQKKMSKLNTYSTDMNKSEQFLNYIIIEPLLAIICEAMCHQCVCRSLSVTYQNDNI